MQITATFCSVEGLGAGQLCFGRGAKKARNRPFFANIGAKNEANENGILNAPKARRGGLAGQN